MIAVTDEREQESAPRSCAHACRTTSNECICGTWRRPSCDVSQAGTKISFVIGGRNVRRGGWERRVMTTLQQIELRCPICDTRFRSQEVVSTNSFGGKRTDFHERAAGTQPLPFLVHMCNRCGYSGAERDFTEEADVTPVLREHVWNELAPQISTGAVLGLGEVRGRGEGGRVAGAGAAPHRRSAAARCLVLRRRSGHRGRALLPPQGGVEVRGGAVELRRRRARGARGADLPRRRALAPGRRRRRRRRRGSTVCRPRSRTSARSSGCSTPRASSAIVRASGSGDATYA